MASYHLSVKIISRSSGRSAVASASYRSRAVMIDERQGMTFDYSKKQDLAYSAIMLPENAPKAYRDREVLWNAVEKAEKRNDAQVSREIEIALPYELSLEKQVSLVREFVNESFVSKGMIADVNIHNKEGNPHAHIMLTMRSVSEDGFGGKVREWNKRDLILEWRQDWANIQNEYLSKDGHAVRVDHKSFEEMGIALDPQVKVGVGEHAYGENGDRVLDLIKILSNNGDAIIENPNIALDYLTKNNSTFTNYDLYKFANAHSYQEPQFRQVVEAVLSSNEIVQLEDEKYSTVSILKTEKEMLEGVAALQQNNKHAVSDVYAKQAIAYRTFGEDQVAAFNHSVNSNGISVVIGHAGTGKSYVLGAVKEAYESDGYIVSGIALAGIAAKNLQESSGVNSTTIYRKLKNWENGIDRLDKNHVLIVDEAGMVGTNQMAHIVKHVNESGAKLILVGDDQQLQAIGAGGPLRCIKEEVGFVSLTDVRRQTEQWQREATVLLAGDKEQIGKAVDLYSSHGNVHQAQNIDEAKQALLHKFCSDYNTDESRLILAHRNKDVLDLNSGARTLLRNNGYLQFPDAPFESSKGAISLAQNDRVVFLEGNNRLGVYNGTLGTVRSNKNGVLRVGVDAGKEIVFNSDDYNKIGHGYAVTIHKSQGATVDKTFILATPGFDKHLGYVSMSRHRDSANLFYSNDSDGFKNIDHLKASLGRDNSKDLAIDYLPADISYHDSKRRAVSDTIDIMMLKTGRVDQALDPKEANKNGMLLIQYPEIGLKLLSHHNAIFTERDIDLFVHNNSQGIEQFNGAKSAIMNSKELTRLGDENFTTRSLVEAEKQLFVDIGELHKKNTFIVSQESVEGALSTRKLGGDQLEAFNSIVQNDSNLAVVHGVAGTGKSYMLGAVRNAFENDGMRVVGVALSGVAARSLQDGSGIESSTIHSKLLDWQKGRGLMDKNHVLVVDEAGMVGTNQMAQIVKHVNESGSKLILVGDDQQLQAVGAGGPLKGIKEEVGFVSLTDVRRQTEQWQREATVLLAGNKEQIGKAIDLYSSHGNVHQAQNIDEAKSLLLKDWAMGVESDGKSRLILTHKNEDALAINLQAREILKEKGVVGSDDFQFLTSDDKVINLADKERVIFTKNDISMGVENGTLGTVTGIKNNTLHVHLDNGKNVEFDEKKYNDLSHGYAVTTHKSQGVTVDKSYVLASPTFDKHLGYVSLTRHRDDTNLYYSLDHFKDEDHLKDTLGRKQEKDLIRDFDNSPGDQVGKTEGVVKDNRPEKSINSKDRHYVVSDDSGRILNTNGNFKDDAANHTFDKPSVALDVAYQKRVEHSKELEGTALYVHRVEQGEIIGKPFLKTVDSPDALKKLWSRQMGENNPVPDNLIKQAGPVSLETPDQKFKISLYEDVNKPFATATVSIPDGLDKEQTKKALNNEIRSLSDSTPGFDMDKTRVKVESVNPVEIAKTKEKSISDDRELSL